MFKKYKYILAAIVLILVMSGCSRNIESVETPPVDAGEVTAKVEVKPEKPKEVKNSKPAKVVETKEEPVPKIGFVQKYVSLNWMDNGKTRMKAKSREFKGDEITRQGVFVDFSAELYENGKLTATLQAPKAVVDGVKRTVVASGGVKMKSMERGTSLVADKVIWYANQKKIVGSGGVKVDSTNGQITAGEIVTDTTLSKIAVRGN